jgi:hypothetical protein
VTEAIAQQSTEWPVVQTDAGFVTLATADALGARAAEWRAWATNAAASAQALSSQAEDHLAAAGEMLVAHSTEWSVPSDLQATVQQARALNERVAADDARDAALKGQEPTAGFFGRIGARHEEHQVKQDRSNSAGKLRALLIPIARSAPAASVAAADTERNAATDLETQARSLEAQVAAAQGRASEWDQEVERRKEAIKAMGFDSLYEAAVLQTTGAQPVDAPLVLKGAERAYVSVPATLARMVTRTHYVGGSSGLSFPIGHTGIRYRVGAFRGEPVHQQSLSKLDSGTFVLTNQRMAYVGRTKSTSVALRKVMHVEVFNDGLSIAREGKENPDFFLMSNPKHTVFLLNWFLAKQSGSS